MTKTRQLINSLENLQLNSVRKVRKCIYPGCEKDTVKNHCVSQALMGTFATAGHVRHLVVNPWIPGGLTFKRAGINNATTFHGLCNLHDHKIFCPIDNTEIDIKDYNNQILLSFRSLLNEKLKKTIKKESYGKFSNENKFTANSSVYLTRLHSNQFGYNLLSIAWYEQELLDEISKPGNKFVFQTFEFPYYEVAGSELFSFEPDNITHMKRSNYARFKVMDPFADFFVHLVPSKKNEKLFMIIGAHKKDSFLLSHFYKYLKSLPLLKALSDMLFLHVEDWVCSEVFFKDYLKGKDNELIKIFLETGGRSVTSRSTDFNLFETQARLI